MHLIVHLFDLFKKIDKRLPYNEFIEIAIKSHAKAGNKSFSYNHFFYYKFIFENLINKYLEKKYINKFQFYFILLLSKVNLIRLYILFLMKDREYYCIDRSFNTKYKYLTLTLGIKRLMPVGFENIQDIGATYKTVSFTIKEKVTIVRKSIANQVLPHLEAQYLITKNDVKYLDLSGSIIVIEECMDFERQIFSDIIQNKCKKLIVSLRGITYISPYFYNAEVRTNNSLTYDLLSKINANVVYQFAYPLGRKNKLIKQLNYEITLGFVSDLGDFILNYRDNKL